MRRWWLAGLLFVAGAGCAPSRGYFLSTHPCLDVLDCICKGRMRSGKVQPYGGVCIPQGPITGPGPALPSVPAIAVPVIPPPAPLPPGANVMPGPAPPPPPVLFPGKV